MQKELSKYRALINQNMIILKSEFEVEKLAIFGSVSRGESTAKSDIDILVEFKKPISLFKFVELENHLSNILGKKVDLSTKRALKQAVKKTVLKEAVYA
jgi:predicted nucleotidyltransferase